MAPKGFAFFLMMNIRYALLALVTALPLILGLPSHSPAQEAKDNPLESDMVHLPPGPFLFGTNLKDEEAEALSLGIPKPWYADETPEKKVFLKGFYLDRYEVTHERYKIFVDDLGAVPPENWEGTNFPEGLDDHPVNGVTWYDAANFCQWAGKELPTEKQWERAARGKHGTVYPWGDAFEPGRANLSSKFASQKKTGKVGSHPGGASAEGAHDLIGNVWEWIRDDYAPYPGNAYRSEAYDAGYKVIRGQSSRDIGHYPGPLYIKAMEKFARSGYREFANPEIPAPDVGFRCASAEPPKAMKTAAAQASPAAGGFPGGNAPASGPDSAGISLSAPPAAFASEVSNPFDIKPHLPQSGILVLILLSFVAGVFSFMSPCTLPILPAYFAITAQTDRAHMGLMSVAFFVGLASLFVLMGASASFLGQFLRDYLFKLTTLCGILVALFGVMTLFGKGFSGATFQGRPNSTLFGFFLFGAAFALGWTPCVGPILSGILILAAADKTVFQGASLLFFYAVGLGLPLILVATFCAHLPKDGLFWRTLRGKGWDVQVGGRTLFLHTTNLFSGGLLILLGVALAMGYLTYINSLIPIEAQIWFSNFEETFLNWFM